MMLVRKKAGSARPAPVLAPKSPEKKPAPPKLRVVPTARTAAVLEFQSDAIELEERKPPLLARLTLYMVVLCIGCAIYWASVSSIDEIVVAPGKLVTTQPVLVVQPLDTSVIRSIEVKPGDIVHKGQRLARLDPTLTAADVDQLQAQIGNFDAQLARLDAELAGKVYVAPANPTTDQQTQGELAAQRSAFFTARLNDFDAQIAQAQATVDSDANQIAVLTQRIAGLKEIDTMNASLATSGSGSRLTFLQARDVSLDTEVTLTAAKGGEAQARQQLASIEAQRKTFAEDYRRTSMETLVDLRDKRDSAAEELKKAQLHQAMAVMVAPADAAVLDVAQRSIGSVVQPAEPLFTLVPLDVPLEAEVAVAARDIGHLALNDPARLKFDAFPFQKYGTLEGKVLSISQDSFAPQSQTDTAAATAGAFYKVRVAIGPMQLRGLPPDFRLLPGLTVEAEINAGKRSVISYFLYPLTRGLDESLHEP